MYHGMVLVTALLFADVLSAAAFSASGRALHQAVRNSASKAELAAAAPYSAPLTVFQDGYYVLNVSIGTPAQTFRLLFDTASANLWVIDRACRTPDCTGGPQVNFTKNRFDGSKSSTYKNLQYPISIVYYDMGEVKGTIGQDKINFQGAASSATFAVINQPAEGLAYWPMDGIIGMAFPPLADPRTDPPFTQIHNLFTVWLDGGHLPSGAIGGQVTFGGLDNTHCNNNNYFYTDVSAEKFWQIPVDQFAVSSYKFAQTQQAFLDTGSDWLAFPPAQIFAIVSATNAEFNLFGEDYNVDCNATLPDISLSIGGKTYTISQDQYTAPNGDGTCRLRLSYYDVVTADPNAPTTVLGQPFLKKRCVAFDVAQERVGIAPANY
ncbi:aspartic protease precursor [Aphelenchoides avenae]|nr:aspartic protease precursor [Aphelenchus avenae]